jgi:hypothetical protein
MTTDRSRRRKEADVARVTLVRLLTSAAAPFVRIQGKSQCSSSRVEHLHNAQAADGGIPFGDDPAGGFHSQILRWLR